MNCEDRTSECSQEGLKIDLFAAARDEAVRKIELNESFFQSLEQEEILGGRLSVAISVKEGAGEVFHVKYVVRGEVCVPCDRCLEELRLPVDLTETQRVSYAEELPTDGETGYIEAGQRLYDTAWDIYEMVETSLPLQRVHSDGECNADMIGRFTQEADNDEETIEEN